MYTQLALSIPKEFFAPVRMLNTPSSTPPPPPIPSVSVRAYVARVDIFEALIAKYGHSSRNYIDR